MSTVEQAAGGGPSAPSERSGSLAGTIGNIVLLVVALTLLSTVTIFDPQTVTEKVLRKIIPPPKPPEETPKRPVPRNFVQAVESVTDANIKKTVAELTSFGTRVPGYGATDARGRLPYQYIRDRFEELGLTGVTVESFKVTVPVDNGASVTVLESKETVPIHCLWPNHVKPPSLPAQGVSGPLVYVGRGRLEDCKERLGPPLGAELKNPGSIVVMDFNSGMNYVNVRKLAAQAVVFIDPTDVQGAREGEPSAVTRGEAADKFLPVPVDIPRYYAHGEAARRLHQLAQAGTTRVNLKAQMVWQEVDAHNVYGWLRGSQETMPVQGDETPKQWKDNIIVLESYFDSMSVAPRIAPGAENAAGMAALLEAARVLGSDLWEPKYSFLFLATDAHFQALSGINSFLYNHSRKSEYFRERIPDDEKIDFNLFIALDLSSHNDQVAAFSEGTFYNPQLNTDNYKKNALAPYAKKFKAYYEEVFPEEPADEWAKSFPPRGMTGTEFVATGLGGVGSPRYLNAITPPKRTWKNYMPEPLALDSEAVTHVGLQGIALATPHDKRERVDTPKDTLENFNVHNVTRQAQTIVALLMKASKDPDFLLRSKLNLRDDGHTIKGRIVWWDRQLKPQLPSAPVRGAVVTYQQPGAPNSVAGVRTLITTMSAERAALQLQPTTARLETALAKPVSFSFGRGTLLATVAEELQKKTAVEFEVARELLLPRPQTVKKVSVEGKPLSEALADVAGAAGCGIQLDGETVRFVYQPEEGEFAFDIKRNKWANTVEAYKVSKEGLIVFAPDMGQEGAKSFPIQLPHGWWEEQLIEVLFKCRSLSIFDIVDSRRLTVLDTLTVLGPDNAPPQQWGAKYIPKQATKEGKVVTAAVVFVPPEERVKLFMSTGLFGIKYLLTNAPEYIPVPGRTKSILEEPLKYSELSEKVYDPVFGETTVEELSKGIGYGPETSVIFYPSYRAARDMWVLDDVRMKRLQRFGVENRRLWELHDQSGLPEAERDRFRTDARQSLLEAKASFDQADYVKGVAAARRAAGLESRGYPDVKRTANDTINGIIFYFALLLPFSFFCERLLVGAPTILKRIFWFVVFFVAVFAILRFVHPAFQLVGSTPYVILLAFVILVLGSVVLFIVMGKFSQEVQKAKRVSAGVHEVDVGRLSATTAAVLLGISNLRRRKLRTALTATTLVLLTFTVLSFTSIETKLTYYKLPRDNRPTYPGALIRDRNWLGLQPSVLEYVKSAFREHAVVVPRAWYQSYSKGERAYIRFRNAETGKVSFANGLVGMVPEEPVATHIDTLLEGEKSRWFRAGDRYAVIIPDDLARLVDITPEDVGEAEVELFGSTFEVIGIINSDEFNKLKDLDDEKLTPVDFVTEATKAQKGQQQDPNLAAAEPIQSFTHLESSNTILLPYDYVIENGGTLAAIALADFTVLRDTQATKGKGADKGFVPIIEQFMSRVALTVFVGTGDARTGKVEVYSSIGGTSISGVANLLIPISVAALIVLNTMIGAVYERSREIGIYNSVGLTPKHIGALFMAESAVFATLGAVIGYLIGQVLSMVFVQTGLLSGINLNYSSLSAIWSTVVVMAVTMLSTLYPSRVAARMAVPDVSRRWKFPEPEGDNWFFEFPFTVGGAEALGLYTYLATVFESYGEGSIGDFVAEDVVLASAGDPSEPRYIITMKCWLAPYDLGISQQVKLEAIPTGEYGIYQVNVTLTRESGDVASWRRINRGFLNLLRKRFLVWRTLAPELKDEYRESGAARVGLLETVA